MNDFSKWLVLIYLISIIALILTKFVNKKLGDAIAVIGAVAAFTMAAFRPNNFPDYLEYVEIFKQASSGGFGNSEYWSSHGEPGFKIMSYAISLFGLDYIWLMIFMALISFVLLFTISRISKIRFTYLWFTYFSIYYLTRDLAQIRLAIASHIIVISVLQRKIFTKLISGAVSSFTFQYFSIIATAASFMSKIRPNIGILIALLLISIIMGGAIRFENIEIFIPIKQLETYQGGEHIRAGHFEIIVPFLRNLIMTIVLYYIARKKKDIEIYRSCVWLAFFSTVSYISFSGILILAYRFAAYFGAIFPIAFAFLLNDPGLRHRYFGLIFFMMMTYFISGFYINDFVWKI